MLSIFKSKPKKIFKVKGMHCASCAMVIESELEDAGVKGSCSYAKQTVEIPETEDVSDQMIRNLVKKAGYEVE